MKKLCVIVSILVIAIIIVLVVLIWPAEITKNGIMKVNSDEYDVKIIIYCKNINLLTGNLSGRFLTSRVVVENENEEFSYLMKGKPLVLPDNIKRRGLVGFIGDKQYERGMLYYDEKVTNIVFISDERQVYAATEEFINLVNSIR